MFFSTILTIIVIVFLHMLWKYFINPYRLVQYYARQGFTPFFYPYKGYLHFMTENLKKYKNIYEMHERFARQYPNSCGIVVNNKEYVIIFLFDLKLKKAFYQKNDKYIKRDSGYNQMLKEVVGDENLLFSENNEWKRRRLIISKVFTFDFIRSLSPMIVFTANKVFDEFVKENQLNSVNIMLLFQEITGRSFVNSFFGQDMSGIKVNGQSLTKVLNDLIIAYVSQAYEPLCFIFGGAIARKLRFSKEKRELHEKNMKFKEEITKIIRKKHELFLKGELPSDNLLSIFFKQNSDLDSQLTDLVNEFSLLYLAGTDTTGHLLTNMLFMLLKHPETKQKLLEEIKNTPNLEDENLTWESFQKMCYLQAFIKETFRVRSPVADIQQRQATSDFSIENVRIRKGTVIQNGFLSCCYDPRFFEEPQSFRPERWMKSGENYKLEEEEPFLLIPFSAGNRNCIGQHLARFEAMIIFVKFLKTFDFEWNSQGFEEIWVIRFLYELKNPLKIQLKLKKN